MRLRNICKSKIHHAVVTGADLNYIGSIGIDAELMRLADLVVGEKVHVWNIANGARVETYAIPLEANSGEIVVNGAAAHHFTAGDRVIIVAFVHTDEVVEPQMLLVDDSNRFRRWLPKEGLQPIEADAIAGVD